MSRGQRLESFLLMPYVVLSPVVLKPGHQSDQMEEETQLHSQKNRGIFPKQANNFIVATSFILKTNVTYTNY